jgi:hypothetical protein
VKLESTESANSPLLVLVPMLMMALLLLAAAMISPWFVPWPRVAAGLVAHRSDLLVLAFGAAGIGLLAFSLQSAGP